MRKEQWNRYERNTPNVVDLGPGKGYDGKSIEHALCLITFGYGRIFKLSMETKAVKFVNRGLVAVYKMGYPGVFFLGRNAMGVGFDELGAEYITRQFYHEPVRHSLCCRGERWKKKGGAI